MNVHTLHRKQILPIALEEAWTFFSSPKNLAKITPEEMAFDIIYISGGDEMYTGQIIRYKVGVFPGIRMNWVTEITHVQQPHFFVDEQRVGPYSLWHHQHHFRSIGQGVEMEDIVNYAIPFGILGRAAHGLFVKRQLNSIFDYRHAILKEIFNGVATSPKPSS